jgi:hypothetical protein
MILNETMLLPPNIEGQISVQPPFSCVLNGSTQRIFSGYFRFTITQKFLSKSGVVASMARLEEITPDDLCAAVCDAGLPVGERR